MTGYAKAIVGEALKVSQIYRENCALQRGIPTRQSLTQLDEEAAAVPVTQELPSPQQGSPSTSAVDSLQFSWLKAAVVGALVAGGFGGGAVALDAVVNREPAPASVQVEQQPAPQPPVSGSLYQFLQDNGFHVPPEAGQ